MYWASVVESAIFILLTTLLAHRTLI
jgi:hypothetical protein